MPCSRDVPLPSPATARRTRHGAHYAKTFRFDAIHDGDLRVLAPDVRYQFVSDASPPDSIAVRFAPANAVEAATASPAV